MDYNNDQNQKPVVINELANKKDSLVTISLVLGILGIVFCWIFCISVIISLIGLIMGIVSIVRTDQHRGVSAAGIITSAIGLVLGLLISFIYILLMG
ncbi:MAG: DUF4190 domain-containing protein [Blautia sp.]|nr:DUF4190 domain-containing protein [Blautia sp.]